MKRALLLILPLLFLLPGALTTASAQGTADMSVWPGNASFAGSGLDRAGTSLASGDFNGDGRWDIAIGAPGANNNAGEVYLFFGSPTLLDSTRFDDLPSQADVIVHGSGDMQLGVALVLGDLNGDGIEDLVIGAPRADNSRGQAWIVFGGTDVSGDISAPDVRLLGVADGDGFGTSLATSVVDPNDTIQDLIVGSPGADPLQRDSAGRIDVILGRDAGWPGQINLATTAVYATLFGPSTGSRFGAALSRAISFQGTLVGNDMNADGSGDVIIGAPGQAYGGRSGAGIVHMFLSSESVVDTLNMSNLNNLVNYRRLAGAYVFDGLGRSLASFTNVNRRGLLIGSPNASIPIGAGIRGGAVYEVPWDAINTQEGIVDLSLPANFRLKLMSGRNGDSLGVSIAAAGSYWTVGATGADPYQRDRAGVGMIFDGPPPFQGYVLLDTLTVNRVQLAGANGSDRIGGSGTLGDFDGDGFLDAAVGSGNAGGFEGRVYIARGGMPRGYLFSPAPGSTGVSTITTITFNARDLDEGLDPDLTYMSVNAVRYLPGDPAVAWESSNGIYSYTITPPDPFAVDVPVPVVLQFSDNGGMRSPLYAYQFVTGRDDRAPEPRDLIPREDEVNVATTRNIEFSLSDPGSGVDSTSVALRVQYPGFDQTISWPDARLSATGPLTSKRFIYNPDQDFPAEEQIDVTLYGQDQAVPPNVMTPYSYHFFTISDTIPPYIDLIQPVPGSTIATSTRILVRVLDASAGIDADNTELLRTQGGNTDPATLTFLTVSNGYDAIHIPGVNPFTPGPLVVTFRSQDLADPANVMPDSAWGYTVVRDSIAPHIESAIPGMYSANAARNSEVRLLLTDNAAGVDSVSVSLSVAGVPINPSQLAWDSFDNYRYRITYRPNPGNPYPDTVYVRLTMSDLAIPSNSLDTTYYFTTEQDTTRPSIVLVSPSPGSDGVSVNETLAWEVGDNLSGVDPTSPFLVVNEAEQTDKIVRTADVTSPGAEYRFSYTPENAFSYEDTLNILFDVYDLEIPPNRTRLTYQLYTEPDEEPPYLADRSPYAGETNVSRGADILFKLLDRGLGVELDSLYLFVENQLIARNLLTIDAVDSGYVVRYNPPDLFAHLDTINVRVVDYDKARNPNRLDTNYWFVTLSDDREPPYITDLTPADSTSNWPIDAGLEFTILDDGQGVDSAFTRIERVGDPLWRYNATVERVQHGFHYTLSLVEPWLYSDTVTVQINARDTADPPNEMTLPYRTTFFVARDDAAPLVANQVPPADSGITINRYLAFDLVDALAGVDTSTVSLSVNGADVLDTTDVERTFTGWHYRYRPPGLWTIGDRITVNVQASDSSASKNRADSTWAFDIVPDRADPYVPVDSLYPVPNSLDVDPEDTLRVVIFDDGIGLNPNRLSVTVAGRSVSDLARADSLELGYEYRLPLSRLNLFAGQLTEVRIDAEDKATPPNSMPTFRFQFAMRPPNEDFSVVPTTLTPNGDGIWDEALIYHKGGPAASITIFDLRGRKVATISGMPARWNGTDDNGDPVPGGLYLLQVKVDSKVRTASVAVAR